MWICSIGGRIDRNFLYIFYYLFEGVFFSYLFFVKKKKLDAAANIDSKNMVLVSVLAEISNAGIGIIRVFLSWIVFLLEINM